MMTMVFQLYDTSQPVSLWPGHTFVTGIMNIFVLPSY